MHYWIQTNMFKAHNHEKLIDVLEKMGKPFEMVEVLPFIDKIIFLNEGEKVDEKINDAYLEYVRNECKKGDKVFGFGSTKLALLMQRNEITPGSMYNDNHDFEVYGKEYGELMLNSDATVMTFADILPDHLPEVFFARPTGDTKSFTGRLFTKGAWADSAAYAGRQSNHDFCSVTAATRVMVCKAKLLYWEVRCWVIGGKVVTMSQYMRGGKTLVENCDHEVWLRDKVQEFVAIYQPAEAFVIDVCEVEVNGKSEVKIIEINTLNCSGFYDANMQKIINALEEHFN